MGTNRIGEIRPSQILWTYGPGSIIDLPNEPFPKPPPEIRRAIYTTNAVESMNYQLRKVTKNRSSFSTDDAIQIGRAHV